MHKLVHALSSSWIAPVGLRVSHHRIVLGKAPLEHDEAEPLTPRNNFNIAYR